MRTQIPQCTDLSLQIRIRTEAKKSWILILQNNSVSDPGSGAFFTPGFGIRYEEKKIRIRDKQPRFRELRTVLRQRILEFFDADPGSAIFLTLDPGWKNSDLVLDPG
jgi:hypothetical protein